MKKKMAQIDLRGALNSAKVFTENIEEQAIGQVIGMLNEPITEGAIVRIMPDVHAGKGSTVGTTFFYPNGFSRVSPNVVGVDIGCGILMKNLGDVEVDRVRLDMAAQSVVPTGFNVNERVDRDVRRELETLLSKCIALNDKGTDNAKKTNRIILSAGSLGGGNHYIELAESETGEKWLSVHTGSRGLGTLVAKYWQTKAEEYCASLEVPKEQRDKLVAELISKGQESRINEELNKLKSSVVRPKSKELSFLEGELLEGYLNDMVLAQKFASINREQILTKIIKKYSKSKEHENLEVIDSFDSIHNFIDVETNTLRKGATSAREGERLVIPLNMKAGSLICVGKGNEDWNNSAPHGAGRVMSRSKAKKEVDLEKYKEDMKDVYTTSVNESTLDEAPDVYKKPEEIIENIKDSVDVVHHLRPLWNLKDHTKEKDAEK